MAYEHHLVAEPGGQRFGVEGPAGQLGLELNVDELEGPEVVKLACKGKGCQKKAKATVRKHKRRVSFTKQVKGMVLRPGDKLTNVIRANVEKCVETLKGLDPILSKFANGGAYETDD